MPAPVQPTLSLQQTASVVRTVAELAGLLRLLRRREARNRYGAALTYRELAARTGWSHAIIGEYLAGTAMPPTDRFDQLIQLLGATRAELGPLASARDRVEELRRPRRVMTGAATAVPAVPGERVPRGLPAAVAGFVGRRDKLAELDRFAAAGRAGTGLPIAAICGGGGVGKTALALQWAHRRAAAFPDGQLYVDLRGFSSRRPLAAVEALGRFLHTLGLEPGGIPAGVDERASRYRTTLAGRRMLVVLDNALSAEQVRPLLPGGGGCLVVVTSRDSLAGLVAADGAQRIQLDVLTETEGAQLLTALITAAPEEWDALARLCGGLPLALRVAAKLAAADPDESLADLRDEDSWQVLLDAGDEYTVRCVLSWSFVRLSPGAARLFRLLGVDPGPDLSAAAAASLTGVPVTTARHLLGELTRAHMVSEVSPRRYAPHAVLRAYAGDLLRREPAGDRQLAIRRLLDHYLHTAVKADRMLHPGRPSVDLVDPAPGVVLGDLVSFSRAEAWLVAERRSLLAAARYAREHGIASHARQLARATDRDRCGPVCWSHRPGRIKVCERAAFDPAQRVGHALPPRGCLANGVSSGWVKGPGDQVEAL